MQEVRREVLLAITLDAETLPHMLARTRDVEDQVQAIIVSDCYGHIQPHTTHRVDWC